MKTAMQELWDYIDANYHEDTFNLYDAKEVSLKEEKEQIIKAVEDTRSNIVPKMFIKENLSGEEYYNQTYNQNK
jgi:hypothetical protein